MFIEEEYGLTQNSDYKNYLVGTSEFWLVY